MARSSVFRAGLLMVSLGSLAFASPTATAQLDPPPAVLVEFLLSFPDPISPGTIAQIPFRVTIQCTNFFQPTPGATMDITFNATASKEFAIAIADRQNDTLGADLVNCPPSEAVQVEGNVTALFLPSAPAFDAADIALEAVVTSGTASEDGTDTTNLTVAFAPRLSVSVGADEARVPPGGNLTVKINVVNLGNAPVVATADLVDFLGTGSLTKESFDITLPDAKELGTDAGTRTAILEVKVQTPSGGLYLGLEGTFQFNVTAVAVADPGLDGGGGEIEYKILVQGTTKDDGDGAGKGKKDSPGFAVDAVLMLAILGAVGLGARRRGA